MAKSKSKIKMKKIDLNEKVFEYGEDNCRSSDMSCWRT